MSHLPCLDELREGCRKGIYILFCAPQNLSISFICQTALTSKKHLDLKDMTTKEEGKNENRGGK
jgi:hypothetical protein